MTDFTKALKIIESNPMLKALDDWSKAEEKRRRKAIRQHRKEFRAPY